MTIEKTHHRLYLLEDYHLVSINLQTGLEDNDQLQFNKTRLLKCDENVCLPQEVKVQVHQ